MRAQLDRNTGITGGIRGRQDIIDATRAQQQQQPGDVDGFEPSVSRAAAKPKVDRSASWNQAGEPLAEEDLERVGSGFDKQPPQALWTPAAVDVQVTRGREQGGLTDERSALNAELARGASEQLGEAPIAPTDLLVLARDAGVPLERQDPQQLVVASNYINRAEQPEQREQRLKAALDTLSILDTIGAPRLQDREFVEVMWNAAEIPGHAIDGLSQTRRDKVMQDVAAATNTPGDHQLEIEGYNATIKVGADNQVVDSTTKKPSPWKMIGKIALNVGLGVAAAVTGGAALAVVKAVQIGMSVYSGVKSAVKGDWAGAISGFAGAFGGVSRVATGAASTSTKVAQTVAQGARVAGSAAAAVQGRSFAGVLGAAAQGLTAASSFSSSATLADVTRITGQAATGASVVESAVRRDFTSLATSGLSIAAGATTGDTQTLLRRMSTGGRAAQSLTQGDLLGAIDAGTSLASQLSGSGRLTEASRLLSGLQAVRGAQQRGDWALASEQLEALGNVARNAFSAPPEKPLLASRAIGNGMATSAMPAVTGTSLSGAVAPLEARAIGNGMAAGLAPAVTGLLPQHTVVAGDRLETLAVKYGVTVQELERANPGIRANRLAVNQKLNVPRGTNDAAGVAALNNFRAHGRNSVNTDPNELISVDRGMTLSKLLEDRPYLTEATVRRLNPQIAGDGRLYEGQQLFVPMADQVKNYGDYQDVTSRRFVAEQQFHAAMRQIGEFHTAEVAYDARARMTIGTGTEVSNFQFEARRADAVRVDIQIDGRTVPIYTPKNLDPALQYHTIDELAVGLAALPRSSRDLVTAIRNDPDRNSSDPHWEVKYKTPGFRSYMTAGAEGVVDVYPQRSAGSQAGVIGALTHESGHAMSERLWGEDHHDPRWRPWLDAMMLDGKPPTAYGANSQGEDFAETLKLYHRSRGTPLEWELRRQMPQRFKIIDQLLASAPR